ncbi:MAG: ATP-binding protein, partial [Steroidobacter sp.]
MNLSIGARIILGFVIALTALLVVGGVSYRNLQELDDDSKEVLRSLDILENKERLTATLAAAQADARGYALSGHEPLAEEFQTESVRMQNVLGQLDALIHDSERRPRLAQLARLLEQRLDVSRRLVQARSESAEAPAGGMADLVREGGDIGVRIRELTLAFEREERDLLERRQARADATAAATASTLLYGTLLAFAFVAIASWLLTRSIRSPLLLLTEGAVRIARGEYQHRVSVLRADEIGALAGVFNEMAEQVEQRQTALAAEDWLKSSLAKFSRLFEGQRDLSVLSRSVLAELAAVLNAPHAAMYTPGAGDENRLHLAASFAAGGLPQTVAPGEGLVGQCWVERQPILVADVPTDYIRIQSALGSAPPSYLAVVPAILDGEVKAVVEAAAFRPLTDLELRFLNQLAESLAIVLNTIEGVRRTDELLRESQALSARLKERQGELAQRNEELETQTERLRQSEQLLQEQQDELKQANEELEQANEELQQANEEMEERSNLLAEQKSELERSNREVEEARQALEGQSQKLALTSRYKSEFLANMSHELRTPLNSLLILSSVLAENAERNLTPKQVQHANTIHESGRDLLALINDILDLSKIEAGAVDVEIDEVRFEALCEAMESTFRPVAESKAVEFRVERDEALPGTMHTDSRRLQQIIKNLLSNALKFTQAGMVELRIYMASGGWSARASSLAAAHRVVAIAVKDSGIGIPQDRQQLIFDAFQQADGSTARKYGGTGLGLSISRQLAQLLGGDLQVQSQPGAGSTFTLYLPCDARVEELERLAEEPARTSPALKTPLSRAAMEDLRFTEAMGFETSATQDDRANLQPADLLLLIIED